MSHYKGRLVETLLETYQNATALLYCPPDMKLPNPGQYLQVVALQDEEQAVPVSVFATGAGEPTDDGGSLLPVLAELPESWQPGEELLIRGPLGRGFRLPKRTKRVALAALSGNPGRMLTLANGARDNECEVALCCDVVAGALPSTVEVRGLADLPAVLAWADYLAVDIKIEELEELEGRLRPRTLPRALETQALVVSPMPCGGMAKCGVCTVATRKGESYLCEDGPVLELRELLVS